jgi:hypothetical protein
MVPGTSRAALTQTQVVTYRVLNFPKFRVAQASVPTSDCRQVDRPDIGGVRVTDRITGQPETILRGKGNMRFSRPLAVGDHNTGHITTPGAEHNQKVPTDTRDIRIPHLATLWLGAASSWRRAGPRRRPTQGLSAPPSSPLRTGAATAAPRAPVPLGHPTVREQEHRPVPSLAHPRLPARGLSRERTVAAAAYFQSH